VFNISLIVFYFIKFGSVNQTNNNTQQNEQKKPKENRIDMAKPQTKHITKLKIA